MVIPVGLLSDTEKQQRRTRGPSADNYWLGDKYYAPRAQNPVHPSPQALQAAQAAVQAAQQVQQAAAVFPGLLHTGDGAQGEGFSGGRADPSPTSAPATSTNADVQASMNANVAPATGLPSLPDFKEAPAAPTAPATTTNQDLAVSEVDPQGPSGANGKTGATAKGAIGAVDKGIAADKALQDKGLTPGEAMNAARSAAIGATVGLAPDTAADMGSRSNVGAENDSPAGQPGSRSSAPGEIGGMLGRVGLSPTEVAAINGMLGSLGKTGTSAGNTGNTGSGIGADGVGGPGAGGMGSPGGIGGGGSGAPGGSSDQGPGSWRKGGPIRGNRNGMLQEVPIVAHEGEFVQKPEAVSYYGDDFMRAINERRIPKKAALGLLAEAHDKPQSARIDRGLLGI